MGYSVCNPTLNDSEKNVYAHIQRDREIIKLIWQNVKNWWIWTKDSAVLYPATLPEVLIISK